MSYLFQIFLIGILSSFLLYVLHLIIHKKFRERDAFPWICLIIFFIGMVLFYGSINVVADRFGIDHEFALLFLLGILFILVILFNLSYKISRLTNSIIELAQKLSLLEFLQKEKGQNDNNTNKSTCNK